MGKTRLFAALLLTTLLVPLPAWAEGVATVVQVNAPLRGVLQGSSDWAPVPVTSTLSPGDMVKTPEKGVATLVLASGAQVTLGAETLVRLESASALRILTGKLRFVAPPAGPVTLVAGNYTLKASDAEAMIQREGGKWKVAMVAGTCLVSDGSRKAPFPLPAGRLVSFEADEVSMAPLGRAKTQDMEQDFALAAPVAQAPNPVVLKKVIGGDRWLATGLSALLPGTGQLYTGDVPRGLVYLGCDFALLGASFYARSIGQQQWANGLGFGVLGLNVLSPLDAYFLTPSTSKP